MIGALFGSLVFRGRGDGLAAVFEVRRFLGAAFAFSVLGEADCSADLEVEEVAVAADAALAA